MGTARALLIGGGAIATILGGIYAVEGGYVNHPNDPGGATNYGITERVARQAGYKGHMRDLPKHCTGPVKVCADNIYLEKYIVKPGFMPIIELDPPVGRETVDSAVNFGPDRPSRWLQSSINELGGKLKVDGKVGKQTVAEYARVQVTIGKVNMCKAMLDKMDAKQAAEYRRLIRNNPKLKSFERGWFNHRIGNVPRKDCEQ